MSLTPIRDNITLLQGATFIDQFACTDSDGLAVDLTGCSARLVVTAGPGVDVPLLVLTSPANGLVITGAAGTIRREITDEQSAAMPAGLWTMEMALTWPDGNTDFLAVGDFILQPSTLGVTA